MKLCTVRFIKPYRNPVFKLQTLLLLKRKNLLRRDANIFVWLLCHGKQKILKIFTRLFASESFNETHRMLYNINTEKKHCKVIHLHST